MILIMNLGFIKTLDLKSQDFRFHLFAVKLTPSKDVVIIAIDQNSLGYRLPAPEAMMTSEIGKNLTKSEIFSAI